MSISILQDYVELNVHVYLAYFEWFRWLVGLACDFAEEFAKKNWGFEAWRCLQRSNPTSGGETA